MTANTPKSIDTHYNGYKFRSRLEARWAVFFDELHIPYAFEPQGFDLNGTRYLPDFHLTNGLILHKFRPTQLDQIWVEIKSTPEITENERQKIAEFVKQTDHHILLIAGQPDINVTLKFIDHHPDTGWFVIDVRWLETPDGQIGLVPIENLNDKNLLAQTNTPRLRYALDKARQSRFEFGQTPTPPSKEAPREEPEPKPQPPTPKPQMSARKSKSRTKPCRACGKEFKPYRPHFIYCASCYHQQKKATPTVIQPPSTHQFGFQTKIKRRLGLLQNSRNPKSCRARLFKGCGVPFLILIAGLVFILWYSNYMITQGLFGASPTAVPIPTETIPATFTPIVATPTPIISTCSCIANTYNCADFATQTEAQACYDRCFPTAGDIHYLDSNEDGRVCVLLP